VKKKITKIFHTTMIIILIVVAVLATWLFMQQDKFGKAPSGARLERIKQSPNFKN
jgi:ribose/xylose/arabinose/galactoside ABC-type transport system permease subunit